MHLFRPEVHFEPITQFMCPEKCITNMSLTVYLIILVENNGRREAPFIISIQYSVSNLDWDNRE